MNESRIPLSRILAIHWYGFRQIIDLGGATIIAGGYGTGKSARNFQPQLLMAVPIDRLGVMHPYADITVLCRKFEHPQIASRRAQLQGLPAIEADLWSYARTSGLGLSLKTAQFYAKTLKKERGKVSRRPIT